MSTFYFLITMSTFLKENPKILLKEKISSGIIFHFTLRVG